MLTALPATTNSAASDISTTESKANANSTAAISHLKTNIAYLFAPSSPNATHPARFRTRALLRSLHYVGIFIFWRIVRYAKIAILGGVVAAVGATALGGLVTGVGAVLVPTSLAGSLGIGFVWAVGKWGFKRIGTIRRVEMSKDDGMRKQTEAKINREWKGMQGPGMMPW